MKNITIAQLSQSEFVRTDLGMNCNDDNLDEQEEIFFINEEMVNDDGLDNNEMRSHDDGKQKEKEVKPNDGDNESDTEADDELSSDESEDEEDLQPVVGKFNNLRSYCNFVPDKDGNMKRVKKPRRMKLVATPSAKRQRFSTIKSKVKSN